MDPPPPSIPTLILLHIILILLHIMYIAFPNLKHCENKCLPINKKEWFHPEAYTKSGPTIKLSGLLFWYLEGLIAWKQIVFVGFISR